MSVSVGKLIGWFFGEGGNHLNDEVVEAVGRVAERHLRPVAREAGEWRALVAQAGERAQGALWRGLAERARELQPVVRRTWMGLQLTGAMLVSHYVARHCPEQEALQCQASRVCASLCTIGWGAFAAYWAAQEVEGVWRRARESRVVVNGAVGPIDHARDTALMNAARRGDCAEILRLQRAGAPLDEADSRGRTAMHWAAAYGQREALELLWWLGGDIRAIDARGHAPLHLIGEDDPLRAVCARLAQMPNRFQMERPLYVLYPPVNLVFKGGGARGIAYVGALAELERRGQLRWVDRVSGTSAGAITAMLVGLGYTSNEIEEILCETNETGVSLNDLIRVIRGATNLVPASNRAGVLMENLNQTVKRGGFCAGNKFFEWIDGVIAKKVGEWAPDREDAGHNLTFGEYRQWIEQGKCKHIRFYAMNIVDQTLVCFSSEDERSKDIVIASAIRASMFIPGAFEPYELFVKREGVVEPAQELGIFIDGGVLYNVPIDDLDLFSCRTTHPSGAIPSGNGQTLGFDLVEKSSKQPEAPQERPSLTVVTQRAAAVLSNREEILRKRRRFDEARLVRIDASRVSLIGGFFINHQNKKELIRSGRRAVRDFFAAQEALVRTEEGQRQDPRPLFSPGTLRILQLSEWPAPAARDLPPAAPARADFREVALPNAPREVGREAAEERKEQDLFEISDNDEDAARPADRGPGY